MAIKLRHTLTGETTNVNSYTYFKNRLWEKQFINWEIISNPKCVHLYKGYGSEKEYVGQAEINDAIALMKKDRKYYYDGEPQECIIDKNESPTPIITNDITISETENKIKEETTVIIKEDLLTKLHMLQIDKLVYESSKRDQIDRIDNLREQLLWHNLIKAYWKPIAAILSVVASGSGLIGYLISKCIQ